MERILPRLVGATLLLFFAGLGGSAGGEGAPSPSATHSPRTPSANRPLIGEACRSEFFALCKHLPNNSPRTAIVDCLKSHPDSLSRDCVEAIADTNKEPTPVAQPSRGGPPGHRGGGRFGDTSPSAETNP
jgi:hypothetical protein